jgi:phosphate-selective porin OprO/OprP
MHAVPLVAEDRLRMTTSPGAATEQTGGRRDRDDGPFVWRDHPSLRLGRRTHIDFRARLQGHLRRSEAALHPDATADFDVARRRIGAEGVIAGLVDFQLERELTDDPDPWRDVFVNYRQFEVVQVQVGKFKLPFSLDENTGATNLDFVYRSTAANQLAPGRDRGVMVHGRVARRRLRYEMGAFDHDGRNARTREGSDVFGGRTLAGRVTAQPFRGVKSVASDFEAGVAFTSSEVPTGYPALRGRTAFDGQFFEPDLWVQGARRRLGVEARWRPGPFSVKSEYMRVTTERRGQSVEDSDLSPLLAIGWYLSGTWAVTGEHKADGLNTPRRPFLQGGAGAIELAARIDELTFGSVATDGLPSTSPRADVVSGNSNRAVTAGVNWYLNRFVKVQANLVRETLADPSRGPMPEKPSFWSSVFRVQLSL